MLNNKFGSSLYFSLENLIKRLLIFYQYCKHRGAEPVIMYSDFIENCKFSFRQHFRDICS